jgi:hypothetical protein
MSSGRRTSQRYAAQVDSLPWLAPEEPLRQSKDGQFIKPIGLPPLEGYVWNPDKGVWYVVVLLLLMMLLLYVPRNQNE